MRAPQRMMLARAIPRALRWASLPITYAMLALITLYRVLLSPFMGGHCRFYPSCSVYAATTIRHHGALVGGARTLWRLARCHPFHPGGFDPPIREA